MKMGPQRASSDSWAWVTSAFDETTVEKAILLAGSLRRVKTAGKLVVITSSQVPEKIRNHLYQSFDLVTLLDTTTDEGKVCDEDKAKIWAFSLALFNRCVYLPPNSLILKKCDEIFEEHSSLDFFIGLPKSMKLEKKSSFFVFKPSIGHFQSMKEILANVVVNGKDSFFKYVLEYAENNKLKVNTLEDKYYHPLKFSKDGKLFDGVIDDLAIVNFGDAEPKSIRKDNPMLKIGLLECFVLDLWWNIYHKEVYMAHSCPTSQIPTQNDSHDPIAVVGMSCRFPGGANSIDEFWKLLIEGREGIQEIPSHRWQKWHTITNVSSECRKTRGGFFDFPIDEFDSTFFNISPKDAEFLDVQQRLLHEISWEALEDAAIDPYSLKDTNGGVFVGSWIHDYKDIAVKMADRDFFRIYMGNSLSATAARLSFFYGMTGPAVASESGCSSAILTVDLACKSLRRRETNLVLAAGVNLFLHPFSMTSMSFVLAPDGRCKTFDEKADGFGRAEGVAVLVMKRLSDAVRDGDKIWGLIKGSAVTQEGISKSLGTPTVQCESLVMDLALKDAQVKPSEVSYVETHGTGTYVGDPIEIKAIENVYSKNRSEPLWVSSVKTNVGHTEACSGITGIIKVLLSMRNEVIPPHLNFTKLNPDLHDAMQAIPAKIPLQAVEWKRKQNAPRIAGVSSFGISGTDGHAIVQEAPFLESSVIDLKLTRPLHIMKISGKSVEALDILLGQYEKMLESETINNFEDIAYTSNTGRATFNHRAVIIAKNSEEALKALKTGTLKRKEVKGDMQAKTCFLFTGQGSQYPGMAKELYDSSPVFRMAFDKCDAILETRHKLRIKNVMWPKTQEFDQGLLNRTIYSQVSIFVVEYCLLRLWQSWGVKPDYVLGHSLGEFAAAVCSKVLDLEAALELVVQRSLLIDALPHGKMLVVKADKQTVEQILSEFYGIEEDNETILDFAALNSPEQTVLAGDSTSIEKFNDFCSRKEVKSIVLASSHAFHSSHMDPILDDYRKKAEKILTGAKENFFGLKSKFISGMEGKLIEDENILLEPEYWIRHTREKVNFIEATKVTLQEGCNIFLEIGPNPVLSAFVMANSNGGASDLLCLPSLRRNQSDWTVMLESLGKLFLSDCSSPISWKGFDQYYSRKKADLPFHPFFKKKIWVDYRSTTGRMHSLLGRVIPNASKSTVFENEITLKQVPYLNDHAIGSTIIFPGAALLEMSIVGGYCAVQGMFETFSKPRRAITLKNLRIEAPLPLQDGKATILQTIIDLNETEEELVGYSVKIHNWLEDPGNTKPGSDLLDGQWKTHASSCFLPLVTDDLSDLKNVDIEELKNSWEKISATKELYEKLPEVGLRFGSTFQSLLCGWRENGNDGGIVFEVKVPSADHEGYNYMIHPVILDAMLQASMIWLSKERLHKKLHVPVSIKEFTWISEGKENTPERFVYCAETEEGVLRTLLLDGNGTILASMSGVEFIETTVKLVESVIQQQSFTMPQLWEEIWKPKAGPLDSRACAAPMEELSGNETLNKEIIETCEKLNELDENELKVYRHLDNLTLLYVLNALHKIGWKPKKDDRIELRSFMEEFGIVKEAWNFMKYFFNEMVTEGILQRVGNSQEEYCYVIRNMPGSQEDIEMLCEQTVVEGETSRGDYRIVSEMGKGLSEFLTGKTSPLSVLFPENTSKPNMGDFYDTMRPWVSKTGEVLNNALSNFRHLFDTKGDSKSVTFRVLEVGGGTGSGTKDYLDFLESKNVRFEYTFTDVSAAFFINAEVKFEKFKDSMKYKKLDMDYDAISQGFTPEYYDLIIACEVLHAAKDIRRTLSNLRVLLKTNGHIQITETTKADRRITLLVGLLEGYWRFTDHDLRPHHATMSSDKWVAVLNECGYKSAGRIGCYNDVHSYIFAFGAEDYSIETGRKCIFDDERIRTDEKYSWLIFCDGSKCSLEIQRRLRCLNRNVTVLKKKECYPKTGNEVDFEKEREKIISLLKKLEGDTFEGILYTWSLCPEDDDNQEQLSMPFFHLCQGLFEMHKVNAKVYIVTQGAFQVLEDSGCPHPQSATIWGIAKTLRNEQPDLSMHCIDIAPEKSTEEQTNEIFYELFWGNDGEELIAFREDKRLVPRLASVKMLDESLKLPSFCDRFQLILPETKAISDLEFGFLQKYKLGENEVEVEVKAAALNFRDIFAVLKPTAQFDKINSIGSDFAGVITRVGEKVGKWKVGDCVFGMNTEQQALPSHVKTKENMIIGIPEEFTFAEAATIPAVFATALYCLVSVAKIKKEDVVLIHTASGGVGLSAVHIANHFGAKVIATAGSRRKRAYLRSLGIEHVFHSRNTEYGREIMEVTKGRGVDIVLNSLTGPGFKEASLDACARNARFVEMSKLNIWKPEEIAALREDVDYTVADLTALEEEEWKDLLEKMMDAMKENFVKPIPYTRFDGLNIRQALSYLQKAKHIGKVVCTMPHVKLQKGLGKKSNLFNERSTYLITGGLGGIGFEVAKFMLDAGAKYLILASRSKPNADVEKTIKIWNEDLQKKVEAWQVDVGNPLEVKTMLDRINNTGWPPLRGVMHAAGVLQDGTIPTQTWDRFQKTYNAKVLGTLNLHEFTKDMRLEHFVLFSSVTSLFGSPGQANHSASNAFEDAFAHHRHSLGLPATTINWANWGECGVAQDIDFPGIRPIATRQGMRALEAVLKSNKLQMCVMNVDSFGMVAKLFPKIKGYVDDKRLLGDVKTPTLIINTDQFWGEVDKADGRESKIDVFKRYIKNMLRSTLKMEPDENIDSNADFQSLGVDSLMLLEMKNYLQNLFGNRLMLKASHLKDCNSANTLATRLVDMLEKRNNQQEEGEGNDEEEMNIRNTSPPVENADTPPLIVV